MLTFPDSKMTTVLWQCDTGKKRDTQIKRTEKWKQKWVRLEQLDVQMQKEKIKQKGINTYLTPYTKIKLDHRPTCKRSHYATSRRNLEENCMALGLMSF